MLHLPTNRATAFRIDTALKADISDFVALNFLDRFESWIAKNLASETARPINEWIHARRTHRVNNLTQLGDGDCQQFVDLLFKYNDADFLEKTYCCFHSLVDLCPNIRIAEYYLK